MTLRESTTDTICQAIAEVMREAGRIAPVIHREAAIREDLALDSLDLAVVVIRLQQQLGVDPFRQQRRRVRTVDDLVAIYDEALAPAK